MAPSQHAKVSPSGLYRLFDGATGEPRCLGSLLASQGLTREASQYAMEGTVAHELASMCILRRQDAKEYADWQGWVNEAGAAGIQNTYPKGEGVHVFPVSGSMIESVQIYLNFVRNVQDDTIEGELTIEQKLDMTWAAPECSGTGDAVIVEDFGVLHVIDYKHGKGVPVEVTGNPQLLAYAVGALGEVNEHLVDTVKVTIVQPRAMHPDGPIRTLEISVDDLYAWAADILKPNAEAALQEDALMKAGYWCRWCLLENDCKTQRQTALEAANVMFDDNAIPVTTVSPKLPETMTRDEMDKVLCAADVIDIWLKGVRAEGQDRLEKGRDDAPSQYKMVLGRKTRSWSDENAASIIAAQILGPAGPFKKSLLTVAQLEKKVKQVTGNTEAMAPLQSLITVKQGHSMAHLSDKRPAVQATVDAMFA